MCASWVEDSLVALESQNWPLVFGDPRDEPAPDLTVEPDERDEVAS